MDSSLEHFYKINKGRLTQNYAVEVRKVYMHLFKRSGL